MEELGLLWLPLEAAGGETWPSSLCSPYYQLNDLHGQVQECEAFRKDASVNLTLPVLETPGVWVHCSLSLELAMRSFPAMAVAIWMLAPDW